MSEKVLPRPVVRDKNGKLIADYSIRDWFLKVQEEIFEVLQTQADIDRDWNGTVDDNVAEELADVITVCIS